ncbi:MAG: hypothetical protein ACRCXT_10225 [Paraclostridium sp.]
MTLAVYLANLQLVYMALMVICILGLIASMFTKKGNEAIENAHFNMPRWVVKILATIIILVISPIIPILWLITKIKACFR